MAVTTKYALAAVILCHSVPSWALGDMPLNSSFKRDILTYCQNLPHPQKAECVGNMASRYVELKAQVRKAPDSPAVRVCTDYGVKIPAGLAATLICFSEVLEVQNATHYKHVAHYPYVKNNMRPYWVSRCAKSYGTEINHCLQKEEAAFAVFWDSYSQQATQNARMDKCLSQLTPDWNFHAVNQCNHR